MSTLSQKEEKKPRKHCIIPRTQQAKILEMAPGRTQEELAEEYGIPRTTLQHWLDRKAKLKREVDPNTVEFFESPSGQAWLHKMVLATFMFFHQNGNNGIPALHEYFKTIEVNKFVGTSVPSLQKISQSIDKQIVLFGAEETQRLAQTMPHKEIPGALDENFIMDEMTLILMDPVSGFILAEEIEEKRDAETWHKVTQAALKGLNVTVSQFVGDEAGGLTKLATGILNVLKGPDLFHVQQEITKGLTSHLGRTLEQVKKKQEDLQKERQEVLSKFQTHLGLVDQIEGLSKRGMKTGKRLIDIVKEEQSNRKKIETTEDQYRKAQEARRAITDAYHPFSLDTGEKQTPEKVKDNLEKSYAVMEAVAKEAGCSDKQKQKLEKAKGSLLSMLAVIMFFFSFLAMTIKSMGLNTSSAALFETLVSIQYLKLCLQRVKKKKKKEQIRMTIEKLESQLINNSLWGEISEGLQTEWWQKALRCAEVFQRSSSCVEGRNGQLSLKFHAFRRINTNSMKVLTILHNFFIRRSDGTTAAERFFEQKQRDLFTSLLDKVELPRPRKEHLRRRRNDPKKQAA